MLMSGGQLLSDSVGGITQTWVQAPGGLNLTRQFASYGAIYQKQLWVYTLVRKRALATRRLPLKVYERKVDGRPEQRDDPYAELLRNPNPRHSGPFLWEWTASTFDIYGEALWVKMRGRDGRPAEVYPIHPSNVTVHNDAGKITYVYTRGGLPTTDPTYAWDVSDVVHFKTYHPDSTLRGLSPLEPLRQTLVNEDAIRRATSAFWSSGARPGTILTHPGRLSKPALDRLKQSWDDLNGGADNFGRSALLEEGLTPHFQPLNVEELQYVESRRLNREECCAAYDVPPPVVHILDRATFSNITEQMRSMYRDTMAPVLSGFEATLDSQLRPDFDPAGNVYAEFLMDEVLRGDFETRIQAWATAIGTGQATPAEARRAENRPFIEGTDVLFRNAALIPVQEPSIREQPGAPVVPLPPSVEPETEPEAKALDVMWGRLGTYRTVAEIDPFVLSAGLNGHTDLVLSILETARSEGASIAELRARLRHALT